MNTDEHDDLWHLLGKAKVQEVSPFFSRNVLRALRETVPKQGGVLGWLRRRWLVAAMGACATLVAGFVLLPRAEQPDQSTMFLAVKVSQSSDYQVINNLDELLASEASSVWLTQ